MPHPILMPALSPMTRKRATWFMLCFFVALICVGVALAEKNGNVISLETYKEWRSDKGTVILDAAALEPLQWIVPQDVAQKNEGGITQKDFDNGISALIPTKETRVILYCYETFMPTRRLSAMSSLGNVLHANGYTNVYTLKKLWQDPGYKESQNLYEKEFAPYTKPLPKEVLILLNKARGNSPLTSQKEEIKNAQ